MDLANMESSYMVGMREITVVHVHIDAIVADSPISVDRDTLRDVNTRRRMAVPLREAKVDETGRLVDVEKEVFWLDITVHKTE